MIRSSDDRHQRLEFLPSRQVPKARATAALAALLFYRVQSSNPRSVPRNEPAHKAPPPSSPALGYYAKGLPAAVVLPDPPAASISDFCSGAYTEPRATGTVELFGVSVARTRKARRAS